ncbi:MAG: OsmC family protein [Bacteroidia bacterium]|nr:OsmC family protein [Bacteroidia bacterium]
MTTISASYLGSLRTQSTHMKSGISITSDAPTDNNGRGEAFSPTDLVCAALCSCMMTLMGMAAEREKIDLKGLTSDVLKIMGANPRKIAEIQITFLHPNLEATAEQKEKLKHAARTCPVALSLSETVKQSIVFNF